MWAGEPFAKARFAHHLTRLQRAFHAAHSRADNSVQSPAPTPAVSDERRRLYSSRASRRAIAFAISIMISLGGCIDAYPRVRIGAYVFATRFEGPLSEFMPMAHGRHQVISYIVRICPRGRRLDPLKGINTDNEVLQLSLTPHEFCMGSHLTDSAKGGCLPLARLGDRVR